MQEFQQRKAEKMNIHRSLEHERKLDEESRVAESVAPSDKTTPVPSKALSKSSPMDQYEMDPELLSQMISVGEATKTYREEESHHAFEETALYHRINSNQIMRPTTGLGEPQEVIDPDEGKLSSKEMLGLYALHNRGPSEWTPEKLSNHFEVDESLVANILKFTSIPKIIPTKVGLEGNLPPQGVWPKYGGEDMIDEVVQIEQFLEISKDEDGNSKMNAR
jgi:hypothetical protein